MFLPIWDLDESKRPLQLHGGKFRAYLILRARRGGLPTRESRWTSRVCQLSSLKAPGNAAWALCRSAWRHVPYLFLREKRLITQRLGWRSPMEGVPVSARVVRRREREPYLFLRTGFMAGRTRFCVLRRRNGYASLLVAAWVRRNGYATGIAVAKRGVCVHTTVAVCIHAYPFLRAYPQKRVRKWTASTRHHRCSQKRVRFPRRAARLIGPTDACCRACMGHGFRA